MFVEKQTYFVFLQVKELYIVTFFGARVKTCVFVCYFLL